MHNFESNPDWTEEMRSFDAGGDGKRDYREDRDRPHGWPVAEAWFCLRTRPRHEHIAAVQLRQEPEIEVYLPRIRFKRPTRSGPVWVTEALFQNYLFARFNLLVSMRRVQAARGVNKVVHFGDRWPIIPDAVIKDLQAVMEGQELREVQDPLQPGDTVRIGSGAMNGLEAVVSRVMPSRLRVAVLLDFLGCQTTVELDRSQLIVEAMDSSRRAWISAPVP